MKEFAIALPDEPGKLAWLTEEISIRSINIIAVAGMNDEAASISLITDNFERTEELLDELGLSYAVQELLVLRLHDKPGELANCCRLLANAGINIESVYMVGKEGRMVKMAMQVDNLNSSRNVLKHYL